MNKLTDKQLPEYSPEARALKLGTYRHFKGGEYKVLGVAKHSEDSSIEFVVYQSVDNGYIWVRPIAMFIEEVDREGYKGPRFKLLE